jgi:hypothetical protein
MDHLGRAVSLAAFAAVLQGSTPSVMAQSQQPANAQSQPANPPAAENPAAAPSDSVSSDMLDEIALTRAAIQTRRQAIVTAAMDLTAPESQAFWPLYRDYRNDMAKVDDRLVDLVVAYVGNYKSLTDETATKLLKDYLDIERERLNVKNQYVPRFLGVLPAVKVARFYQIDNKLDKKIQGELAAEIPLAR